MLTKEVLRVRQRPGVRHRSRAISVQSDGENVELRVCVRRQVAQTQLHRKLHQTNPPIKTTSTPQTRLDPYAAARHDVLLHVSLDAPRSKLQAGQEGLQLRRIIECAEVLGHTEDLALAAIQSLTESFDIIATPHGYFASDHNKWDGG